MKKCLETGRPYNKLTLDDADSNQACEFLYGIPFGERICQPNMAILQQEMSISKEGNGPDTVWNWKWHFRA